MALILKDSGSFSADGTQMFFEDTTGAYNVTTKPGGWGSPNPATTDVTTFQIVCNWISAGATVTYNFTVAAGTITVATMTDTAGTVFNIFSELASTSFPFDSPDLFDLTDTFSTAAVLPALEDGQFSLVYKVVGVSGGSAFAYTTSTTFFRDCDLRCCLTNLRLTADINCDCCDEIEEQVNTVEYWWHNALCAVDTGKADSIALSYFTKAQEVCASDCGCS